MNQTLLFIQANMHRAIQNNERTMEVSILDLKELLGSVMRAEGQKQAEFYGHGIAWANPVKMQEMREGKRFYLTVRRRKNDDFSEQIFCIPDGRKPVDCLENIQQD